ncbi:helix-turn-helix domain-containing protein [Enterococcus sp. AZ126]|uniref:Rgg family transcriptional regulator n=1 Tax=Enterococcus sp. AZ126 TaxID=2774635 RepID=UPI003F217322
MNIQETLKYFRKKLQFRQKDVLQEMDSSVYSRIESGHRELKLTELTTYLDTLSLLPEEFFSLSPLNAEQQAFNSLFFHCSKDIRNSKLKKSMLQYYKNLQNKSVKTLREKSNYLVIRNYFAQFWKEIDKLTTEEATEVCEQLLKKSYYQYYDYTIVMNLIRFFDKKKTDKLVHKMLLQQQNPTKQIRQRCTHILLNLITMRIYEKDFDGAKKYIYLAKKQDPTKINLHFQINLKYLENLLTYQLTGNYDCMQRIQEYIHLLKDIGDYSLAEQIEAEIKLVVHNILDHTNQSSFPVTVITET